MNGNFEHRLILEYLTAKAFFDKCNLFPLGIAPIKELFFHYNNPYWHNVIRLFLDIAETSLSTARLHTLYSAIIETREIKDYTLLFDGLEMAEDAGLIKLLIKDILAKSINGQYPPYGPLFYYIPRYFLYGCLLEVLNEDFRGDARALALTRDVCFYGGATTIGEILDSIDGQALFF